MKKSNILLYSLACLMIFAIGTKWITPIKIAVIFNAVILLLNSVYLLILNLVRKEKKQ